MLDGIIDVSRRDQAVSQEEMDTTDPSGSITCRGSKIAHRHIVMCLSARKWDVNVLLGQYDSAGSCVEFRKCCYTFKQK